MIFPFKIKFKQRINAGNIKDEAQILQIIKDLLPIESPNNIRKLAIDKNILSFSVVPTQGDFMMTLEKGKFVVSKEYSEYAIPYTIYIFRFFFIYFLGITLVAMITQKINSGRYHSFFDYWLNFLDCNRCQS